MGLIGQLSLGTVLLLISISIHVGAASLLAYHLRAFALAVRTRIPMIDFAVVIAFACVVIVLSHTVQVWLWAFVLVVLGALPEFPTALYFSLATYTTLGYGDITLSQEFALFASFGAVTGLLAFGVSTAILFAIVSHFFPDQP